MKNLDISYLLDIYGPVLTEKQRDVVELYYCEDLSLAEIAEICGITRQGVRDSIKRGEAVILELEEKLGFVKKLQDLYKTVDEVRGYTNEIILYNDRIAYSEQIKRLAESIMTSLSSIDEE
ncbi:MAG: DNA-binding protein [Oscillospiraceae bacterium]|nr:DNA-binding protein [Oscillospiraceae bacterium]